MLSIVVGLPYVLYVWKLVSFVQLSPPRGGDTLSRLNPESGLLLSLEREREIASDGDHNDSDGSAEDHEVKYDDEDQFIMLTDPHKMAASGSADPASMQYANEPAGRSSAPAMKLADGRSSFFKNFYGFSTAEESINMEPRTSLSKLVDPPEHNVLTSHSHIPQVTPTGFAMGMAATAATAGTSARPDLVHFDSGLGYHTIELATTTLRRLHGDNPGMPMAGGGGGPSVPVMDIGKSVSRVPTEDFVAPVLRSVRSDTLLGVPESAAHVQDVSGATTATNTTNTTSSHQPSVYGRGLCQESGHSPGRSVGRSQRSIGNVVSRCRSAHGTDDCFVGGSGGSLAFESRTPGNHD